ncbi:MAG: DUF4465 domain-containing protein [Fimbriiglobus sp.]
MSVASVGPVYGQPTATFEDLPLTGPQTFQNGATLLPAGSFASNGVTFDNNYSPDFGGFWDEWSYSNVFDTTTAGFGNQYAAYNVSGSVGAAGDGGSANYGVFYQPYTAPTGTVSWAAGLKPDSIRITNTTYAALSMRDGDAFAKQFNVVDQDFFKLTITGLDGAGVATGSTVDFFLADFRTGPGSIVNQWTTVGLTPLGPDARSLQFSLTSTDNGMFGMNTPAFFAADNLMLAPVPEPTTVGLAAAAGLGAVLRWRRRRSTLSCEPGLTC